jgi:hypothetical protein
LRAGVTVPVPRPAETAALLDDPHVVDAGFLEPGAGDEAGEAAADKCHGHVVVFRVAVNSLGIRITEKVAEPPS